MSSQRSQQRLEEEKLQAEINKLNAERDKAVAETKEIRHKPLARASFWISVGPAILVVAALVYAFSDRLFDANNRMIAAERMEISNSIDSLNRRKTHLDGLNLILEQDSIRLELKNDSLKKLNAALRARVSSDDATIKAEMLGIANLEEKTSIVNKALKKSEHDLDSTVKLSKTYWDRGEDYHEKLDRKQFYYSSDTAGMRRYIKMQSDSIKVLRDLLTNCRLEGSKRK